MQEKPLKAFRYQNVALKDSRWKRQFNDTLDYYMNIPDDSLLFGFRKRMNFICPGEELSGWYSRGVFHVFGQIMGSLAKMACITQDFQVRQKTERLVEEWAKCIEPDGYCFQNPRGLVNDLHYEYEKLVGGLLDAYEYAGVQSAIGHLSRITDWAVSNLDRNVKKLSETEQSVNTKEWYTLSENLYRAYLVTGDEKYKTFAQEWEHPYYWNAFRKLPFKFPKRHAYSHVNSLSGAAAAYMARGGQEYLELLKNAYELLTSSYVYATGGYGPDETLFGAEGYMGEVLLGTTSLWGGHAEIPCGSWAVFKLSRYLMEFTGEAKYGDWAERMLYNGIGAELPMAPGGKVMYYGNYNACGSRKTVEDARVFNNGTTFEWQCCTGTYPQAAAEYYNMIYYQNQECLAISQYLPSHVRWERIGGAVEVDLATAYPEDSNVSIGIHMGLEQKFALKFRIPSWLSSTVTATVNGQRMEAAATPGEWLTLERTWQDGDRIALDFPMKLRFEPVDSVHANLMALCCGPVVLAADRSGILVGDSIHPSVWIVPMGASPLSFETLQGHVKGYDFVKKIFKPFYEAKENEWYYLYNRVENNLEGF